MISVGFAREFIDLEKVSRNSSPVLYEKDIVDILQKPVFLASRVLHSVMVAMGGELLAILKTPGCLKTLKQLRYSR